MSESPSNELAAASSARSGRERSGSALRSPWFIAWIALVVIVLGVNATMIFLAYATNPGLVVDDYYERGRNVEQTLATRRAEAPGWEMSIDLLESPVEGQATTVRFFVVDSVGQPVRPESVTYYAYRPSDASADFSVPMTEEAPGRYVAEVSFAMSGVWDTLVAAQAETQEVVLDQRISVATP